LIGRGSGISRKNGASSEHADEAIRNPQKDAHETDQNDERTEDEAL
jgi:hypothetical protein